MDFAPLIDRKTDRFRELEAEISSANLYDDPGKAREILREHTRLKELLAGWELLKKLRTELAENQ
jgi:peptide chain release factor 1